MIIGSSSFRKETAPRGPKLPPLTLSDEQRDQLRGVARSTSLPHGLVLRARMILAEGLTNRAVAERVGASPPGQVASTLPRARRPRPARRTPPRSSPQEEKDGRRLAEAEGVLPSNSGGGSGNGGMGDWKSPTLLSVGGFFDPIQMSVAPNQERPAGSAMAIKRDARPTWSVRPVGFRPAFRNGVPDCPFEPSLSATVDFPSSSRRKIFPSAKANQERSGEVRNLPPSTSRPPFPPVRRRVPFPFLASKQVRIPPSLTK